MRSCPEGQKNITQLVVKIGACLSQRTVRQKLVILRAMRLKSIDLGQSMNGVQMPG